MTDDDDWLQRKLKGTLWELNREQMRASPQIVLVDPEEAWLNAMRTFMKDIEVRGKRVDPQIRTFQDPADAMTYMRDHRPAILVTEVSFSHFEGHYLGVTLIRQYPDDPPPVILHSADADIDLLEQAKSLAGPDARIELLPKTHPTDVTYAVAFLLAQLWED